MKRIFNYLFVFVALIFINDVKVYGIEKTIDDLNYGINGKVVIPSFYEKMEIGNDYESLIITSSNEIAINYKDGFLNIDVLGSIKDLIVVDDINKDGFKDIIYAANQVDDFYNLVAVSGKNASIIWKQKVTEEIYNSQAGFINQNMTIYKIKQINNNIAVIYDYNFVLYDLKTGKKKFIYEEKDNIWDITEVKDINKDKINDYVISNQLGEIKAFSGKTNKLLWTTLVTPNLKIYEDNKYLGKVTRNLWQVEYINDSLYTMGEDGFLYNINYKNGKIINKLSIYEFDDVLVSNYYKNTTYNLNKLYPISKNSSYYKMFEIVNLNEDKIIVKSFINNSSDNLVQSIEKESYGDTTNSYDGNSSNITQDKPFFALVNLKDKKIEYKVILNKIEIYNTNILEINNEFIIPLYVKDGKLVLSSYNKETGEELKEYQINIGYSYTSESLKNIYLNKYNDNILLESKDSFSYLVKTDLKTIIKNNDALSYSHVLSNNDKELTIYYKTNDVINKIVKYSDYSTKKESFEYNIPTNFKNNGFSSISITHDFNNDGVKDLTALINKLNDQNEVIASYFLILNMKTGKVISLKNIFLYSYKNEKNKKIDVYLTGFNLNAVKDVNNDKKNDLILDNNIIDGIKFKVIGSINEGINKSGNTVKIGDVNKDGFDDFILIGETKSTLYTSKESQNDVTYNKTKYSYSYNKNLMNHENYYKAPDINNDGINELIFNAKNEKDLQYYVLVSGKDMHVICSLDKEGINESNTYGFLNFDTNNDGYNDIYKTSNWGSQANIISGKNGEALLSFPLYENSYEGNYDIGASEPGTSNTMITFYETSVDKSIIMGEDLNNDGYKELFFLREEYYPEQKLTLEAYDIYNKNNKALKKYNIDTHSETELYYSYVAEENMDYTKKLIHINNSDLYIYKSSYLNKNIVYDIKNEKEISGFSYSIDKAYINNGTILGIYNDTPLLIKYENEFKLKGNSKDTSILNLTWEYKETGGMNIVKIYDNGKYIKSSYSDNAKVLLPLGNHKIFIESIDKWGKISNYSLEVNIKKSLDMIILISLFSIISILLILYLILNTKIRRERAIRRAS